MNRIVVWNRIDTLGVEYAEIGLDPPCLEGEVVLCENGASGSASYRIEYDDAMRARDAFVRIKWAGERRECRLARSATGDWTQNGVSAPLLEGLVDVDLSITPSTNTPPLLRLKLGLGRSEQVTAAWVRFPELDVVPLRQIYRRVEGNSYEYEAPDLAFRAVLECDDHGIVQTYGDLWKVSSCTLWTPRF